MGSPLQHLLRMHVRSVGGVDRHGESLRLGPVAGRSTVGLARFMAVATRIVIIGGGPAGYEAALVAAARGPDVAEVTVVDSDGIGGACVLWDCVPSKTFIASTGVRTELRRAPGLGFDMRIRGRQDLVAADQQPGQDAGRVPVGRHRRAAAQRGRDVVAGRGELVDDLPGMAPTPSRSPPTTARSARSRPTSC